MKIVVCVKAIPRGEGRLSISESGDRVICEGAGGMTINESDEYALEQGSVLKTALGAELIAITVGPLTSQEALCVALAKGADKAVRMDADISEPDTVARVLASAIERLGYDLILTGVESWDYLWSQVGILLATKLGIPSAYAVTGVEFSQDRKSLRVTKELRGGASQYLGMELPALLCVQYGMHALSFVPPRRQMWARSQPQDTMTLEELGIEDQAETRPGRLRILEVGLPERKRRVQFLEGRTREIADQLMGKIRHATQ